MSLPSAELQRGPRYDARCDGYERRADDQYITPLLPRQETDTYSRLFINVKFQSPNLNDILRQIIPDINILLGRPSTRRFVDDCSFRTGESAICVGVTGAN